MKLPTVCHTCPLPPEGTGVTYLWAEVNDEGVLIASCEHGHKTVTVLQEQKFEILFEFGALAILDGYFREAISGFAVALERSYEFATKVLVDAKGVRRDKFDAAWKLVSSQSERQLGAVAFCFLLEFGVPLQHLPPKAIELRNNAIHKGSLCSREQALSFGDSVLAVIFPMIKALRERHPNAVESVQRSESEARHKDASLEGKVVGHMTIGTAIGMRNALDSFGKTTLIAYLSELSDRKRRHWGA